MPERIKQLFQDAKNPDQNTCIHRTVLCTASVDIRHFVPEFPLCHSRHGKKLRANHFMDENGIFPDSLDDESPARLINDSVGITGWYIPWDAGSDSISFQYQTVHFRKNYEINLSFLGNKVGHRRLLNQSGI
jgi:hypothetical protein